MNVWKIYKNTGITEYRNADFDNIEAFLSQFSGVIEVDNGQHVKHVLNGFLKVNLNQSNLDYFKDNDNIDYLSIQNTEDTKPVYYFVNGKKWIAENTIQLEIKMDTIVTMNGNYELSEKTNIIRQHEDRFVRQDSTTLVRLVDKVSEDVTPALYKTGETHVTTYDDDDKTKLDTRKMYLIYYTDNTDADSLVKCYAVMEKKAKIFEKWQGYLNLIYALDSDEVMVITPDELKEKEVITDEENARLTVGLVLNGESVTVPVYYDENGILHTVALVRVADTGFSYFAVRVLEDGTINKGGELSEITPSADFTLTTEAIKSGGYIKYSKVSLNDFVSATTYAEISENRIDLKLGAGTVTEIGSIKQVDRTDTKLIKIIEAPYFVNYLPRSGSNYCIIDTGFVIETVGTTKMLRLDILNQKFKNSIYCEDALNYMKLEKTPSITDIANIENESKLYNSSFYYKKFVYDSFNYVIAGEKADGYSKLGIDFYTTTLFNSKFLFMFDYKIKNETGDFDKVLLTSRNNEEPIYNSSYLNYVKTGYNYDVKTRENTQRNTLLMAGMQLGIGLVSMAAGTATGGISAAAGISLVGSAVTTLTQTAITKSNSELAQQQKMRELEQQSASVSGGDDLDLLNDYCGNKAKMLTYECSDEMKENVYELFKYYGYKSIKRGVPNTTSRYWYNFIQADIELKTTKNIDSDIEDDIKNRYKAGLTVFHYHAGKNTTGYDYEQELENWETSLNPVE